MAVMSHGCAPVLALGLKVEDDPAWRKEMTSFTFGKNIFHAALHNKNKSFTWLHVFGYPTQMIRVAELGV